MNWEPKKFSQIMTVKKGEPITKAEANEGQYPVILGGKEPAYFIDRFNHEGKAIVVSRSGASAGFVSYWNEPIFITDGFLIEPLDGNCFEYVYYLLKYFGKALRDLQNGSAIPHVTPKTIYGLKAPVPTSREQERIVSILSAYDNLIEVNNKRIKVLEQMAENLYKEWFVRFRFPGHESIPFENGLPQGWKQDTASSVFNITIGKTPPRKEFEWFTENDPNAVNWVSVSDMKNAYVFTTDEQLTRTAIDRFNMIVVPKNTVLLSFKLTVGRVSIAQTPCATNEAIAHFGGMSETYREFLYYQLKNYDYSKLGNTSSIGNAVNSKVIKNMKLLYPEEIVLRRFHETSKPLVDEIISICSQNQILICQRDLLLPRLMSGKLEV